MVEIGSGFSINLQRVFNPVIEAASLRQSPEAQMENFNIAMDEYNVIEYFVYFV